MAVRYSAYGEQMVTIRHALLFLIGTILGFVAGRELISTVEVNAKFKKANDSVESSHSVLKDAGKISALYRAWLDHEKHEILDPAVNRLEKEHPELGPHWLHEERWKNYAKEASACPPIAEIVRVKVDK